MVKIPAIMIPSLKIANPLRPVVLAAIWCGICALLVAAEPPRKPNVIVFFSDDHGWADLGAQGIQSDLRTPNLDALAAGGLRAVSGYVTAPQCVPSRAGLLTGRYQNRFGVESNADPLDGFSTQRTLAQRLKAAGYATGMAGKWHLGPPNRIAGLGFDDVFYQGGTWTNFDLEGKDVKPGIPNETLYHLDAHSAAACAFIQRHQDQPFFFYLAYRAPHVPLDAPEKYTSRFPGPMPERRRQALAMIAAMDDGVGQILATLRQHGLEEQTLIFFLGDNGAPLKIHKEDAPGGGPGWDGSLNAPMNGEKGMLTEGGIRVPWLAYWKGTIPGGQVYAPPVSSLDVAATAVAVAGLPHDAALDGVNLVPFFTGHNQAPPHDALYWRWIDQSAIRAGKWKLLVGGPRSYLFDLEADAGEKNNLLAQHPDVAQRLRSRLEAWAAQLQPPGINAQSLAQTWADYYDFYLDGKPAPPKQGAAVRGGAKDWVVRNGTGRVKAGALHVAPDPNGNQPPFVALSRLSIPGPATATVSMRSAAGGQAGFAWRLDGQKTFPPNQTVTCDLAVSPDWQQKTLDLPATGQIIHLRVLLPKGTTEVRRVEIKAANGNAARHWNFESR